MENETKIGKMVAAVREKDKGNEAFKAGEFQEALVYYTKSLAFDQSSAASAIVFSNRGLVQQKLKKFENAEKDYSSALEQDPKYVKAFSRRATTRISRGKFLAAIQDTIAGLAILPNDKELLAQQREAEKNYVGSEGSDALNELRKVYGNPSYISPFMKENCTSNAKTGENTNGVAKTHAGEKDFHEVPSDTAQKKSTRIMIEEVDEDDHGQSKVELSKLADVKNATFESKPTDSNLLGAKRINTDLSKVPEGQPKACTVKRVNIEACFYFFNLIN